MLFSANLQLPTEKKKAQPKSLELYFIWQTFWGLQAGMQSLKYLWETAPKMRQGKRQDI